MRSVTLILLIFFMSQMVLAQQSLRNVSLSFENVTREAVLERLEATTEYKTFYLSHWLGDDLISGEYENVDVEVLLERIFEETNINYFIFDTNRIVLTENNSIYGALPDDFFERKDTVVATPGRTKTNANPIFYKEANSRSQASLQTYRIGKENRNDTRQTYTLSGYAKNSATGKTIEGLSIQVKNSRRGTVTDFDGFYNISLNAGLNILEIRALGIENTEKRVLIYNDGALDFELNESLEQLDEVVVSADIYSNVEETTTGGEEIDVEESKTIPLVLGERDVLKVATTLPGITTAGEGSAGFNVRGGKTDQNLILFDDAVLYSPQHFFGIFSALNPFAIGEFNIYKGSIPAEYGGRLSSVFDIRSKDGNMSKFSGEASIGPVTSNVVVEIPVVKEKASLLIGGRGAYANWILRSIDEESLNNSQASFYDAMASYTHHINEKNTVKATGYLSRDDFSITSDSLYVYKNQLASLNWRHKFNDKNSANLMLSNSEYNFQIDFERGSNDDFILDYSINETDVKLKFNYGYNPKLTFNYGVEGKLYNVRPGSIQPLGAASIIDPMVIDTERALETGAFVSGRYDVSKKLSIDAGLRYSFYAALGNATQRTYLPGDVKNEGTVVDTLSFGRNEVIETYGGPEVRLSARYLLTPDLSVKAGYGNTIQYIHRLTNNTTVSPIDTWKLSDKNIAPQRGQQFSLGFFKNFDANAYELSIEGFYKKSRQILDFKTGAQLLLNRNIETQVLQGDGKSYGLEFLVRKNKGNLNGWLSYTYARSLVKFDSPFSEERINNGAFFPSNFDRPHDISLVGNYKFTRRYSLSANFVYQTGRPVTVPVGNFSFNNSEFAVFSDRNSFRIPDFYRLDLGFNIEGNHKIKKFAHSFWTISIYNVLGRNNPFSVFFVTEDGQVRAVKSSIFTIPVPAITYNFKF